MAGEPCAGLDALSHVFSREYRLLCVGVAATPYGRLARRLVWLHGGCAGHRLSHGNLADHWTHRTDSSSFREGVHESKPGLDWRPLPITRPQETVVCQFTTKGTDAQQAWHQASKPCFLGDRTQGTAAIMRRRCKAIFANSTAACPSRTAGQCPSSTWHLLELCLVRCGLFAWCGILAWSSTHARAYASHHLRDSACLPLLGCQSLPWPRVAGMHSPLG